MSSILILYSQDYVKVKSSKEITQKEKNTNGNFCSFYFLLEIRVVTEAEI